LSEAGIAQGIRRIVGCTGAEADAATEVTFIIFLKKLFNLLIFIAI